MKFEHASRRLERQGFDINTLRICIRALRDCDEDGDLSIEQIIESSVMAQRVVDPCTLQDTNVLTDAAAIYDFELGHAVALEARVSGNPVYPSKSASAAVRAGYRAAFAD